MRLLLSPTTIDRWLRFGLPVLFTSIPVMIACYHFRMPGTTPAVLVLFGFFRLTMYDWRWSRFTWMYAYGYLPFFVGAYAWQAVFRSNLTLGGVHRSILRSADAAVGLVVLGMLIQLIVSIAVQGRLLQSRLRQPNTPR